MYYVISQLSNELKVEQVPMNLGLILVASGHLTYMLAIVLGLDALHRNLLSLADVLDTLEENLSDEGEKIRVRNLRRRILGTGQITGLGFFNIDKQSFVGMMSFAATYIVILVQFKEA